MKNLVSAELRLAVFTVHKLNDVHRNDLLPFHTKLLQLSDGYLANAAIDLRLH